MNDSRHALSDWCSNSLVRRVKSRQSDRTVKERCRMACRYIYSDVEEAEGEDTSVTERELMIANCSDSSQIPRCIMKGIASPHRVAELLNEKLPLEAHYVSLAASF